MNVDLAFAHSYDVEVLDLLAEEFMGPIVAFQSAGSARPVGSPPAGMRVAFRRTDETWVGVFPLTRLTSFSGVFATPSPRRALVVATGMPYLVDVEEAAGGSVEPVGTYGVVSAPAPGLLLALAATHVVAYDADGCRWTTRRLSFDGIEIESAAQDVVRGSGWDARVAGRVHFAIDTRTGETTGGLDVA